MFPDTSFPVAGYGAAILLAIRFSSKLQLLLPC